MLAGNHSFQCPWLRENPTSWDVWAQWTWNHQFPNRAYISRFSLEDWRKKQRTLTWIIRDSSASTVELWERCSRGKQQVSKKTTQQVSKVCLLEITLKLWKNTSRKEGMKKHGAKAFSYMPRIWKNERTDVFQSKQGKGKLEKIWEEVTWTEDGWANEKGLPKENSHKCSRQVKMPWHGFAQGF